MTHAERWKELERLYHEAVERPPAERGAFLASACGGDESLRKEVESLLAHDAERGFDEPALDQAAREIAAREQAAGARGDPPSLVGRRLGGYEVLSLLGVGGMGEVYRARDTRLGREVALKLLPRELAADPERLGRLEREARLLAALNHPGIATLYGLERAEGQRFLVMERVPGPTLAERLQRGRLVVAEALSVGRQIAEALEAAHERGVVHRDLKPGNVKVTPEGRVKLLDFGLAKALEGSGTEIPPAASEAATREGTILGTPAYMSPEQACGQPVDRRTDIWSFGCCLYEALTGRRAFAGDTVSDTLAAVLDREPDWNGLPRATPNGVERLLRRCLTRDVRRRLQHIGDARLELEEGDARVVEGRQPGRRISGTARWALSGALVGALATGVGLWLAARAPGGLPPTKAPVSSVVRLTLKLEGEDGGLPRLGIAGRSVPFALSPDGSRLVIHGRGPRGQQLFLRELAGFDTKALPGTEGGSDPFWSPDGRWVGFWRAKDHELWKVSVAGGPPIRIAPTDIPAHGALWGENGQILLDTGRLWSIPSAGGDPRPIPIRDRSDEEWISLESRIPGRSDLLVASVRDEGTWLEVLSRRTGERRRLLRGGRTVMARFTPSGHLVYADGDTLFAVPMDMERLEPLGSPVPVMNGIDHFDYHSNVSLSDTGTVVYLPSGRVRQAGLEWIDRRGKAIPVPHLDSLEPDTFSLSPDGRKVAVALMDGARPSVWILDLERGSKRLLAEGAMDPLYSRDGAFVTYMSFHGEQFVFSRRRADGTGEEERLFTLASGWADTLDWSPDGRSLLLSSYSKSRDADVWIHSDGKTAPLLAGPANEWSATFSPDGRFVAFDTDEGGEDSVYLQPFPGPGPRTVVSIGGGSGPRWGHDGRLFYWSGTGQGQRMMAVDVKTAPVLRVGRPQALFETDRRWPIYDVDVAADGRFLALRRRETVDGPLELRVVLNWFEELERLAPHPRR